VMNHVQLYEQLRQTGDAATGPAALGGGVTQTAPVPLNLR